MTATASEALVTTMTAEEANVFDKDIRRGLGEQRARLYLLHLQRGFMHLADDGGKHFENIGEYAESRLDMGKSTAYDWIAQVEVTLDAKGITIDALQKSLKSSKVKDGDVLLPSTITRQLRALPTAELRAKAYKTMEDLKGAQTMTADEFKREWGKLVNREMVSAGLRNAPGRPKHETNGAETTETIETAEVSTSPASSPSVHPAVTTGHSTERVVTPPTFDFDDKGEVSPQVDAVLNSTTVQDLATQAEKLGFAVESLKAVVSGEKPLKYVDYELTAFGVTLTFELPDGTSIYAELTDNEVNQICKDLSNASE